MPTEYYRYLSDQQEIDGLRSERKVESTNPPKTWYTPTRYDSIQDAEEELSLPQTPSHRIGPINEAKMPPLDIGPRRVQPDYGHPGGGWEVCIKEPIYLLGLKDMNNGGWTL